MVAFSLFYFANEAPDEQDGAIYQLLLAGARFADRHGLAAVWMPERHFHPFGGIYPNPAVTAAALATITEHVALRAGSVVAPLHHPIRIAEEWAVVDNLSDGRVGISFAPGWHHEDFVLAPERFPDRRTHMADAVHTVRSLWRGEEITAVDGNGAPARIRLHPRPIQPELPVWLTASGSRSTFELAGTLGAGVLTHVASQDYDTLRAKIAHYRTHLHAAHPGRPGHVAVMLHTFIGHDVDAVRSLVREPMHRYLRSSLDLRVRTPSRAGRVENPRQLGEREIGLAVRRAFDRYFEQAGLFGPLEHCADVVERLVDVGVDEIACLIDYGPGLSDTMDSLDQLVKLRERVRSTR